MGLMRLDMCAVRYVIGMVKVVATKLVPGRIPSMSMTGGLAWFICCAFEDDMLGSHMWYASPFRALESYICGLGHQASWQSWPSQPLPETDAIQKKEKILKNFEQKRLMPFGWLMYLKCRCKWTDKIDSIRFWALMMLVILGWKFIQLNKS